jgi:hypothetical protein
MYMHGMQFMLIAVGSTELLKFRVLVVVVPEAPAPTGIFY